MIRQCFIIFGCLAIGELIVWLTGITIPSSIIGMMLLAAMLQMKVIKVEWVKGMSDFLISNMGFFFAHILVMSRYPNSIMEQTYGFFPTKQKLLRKIYMELMN